MGVTEGVYLLQLYLILKSELMVCLTKNMKELEVFVNKPRLTTCASGILIVKLSPFSTIPLNASSVCCIICIG